MGVKWLRPEIKKIKMTRHLKSIRLIRECLWVMNSNEILCQLTASCVSHAFSGSSASRKTCWLFLSLQESLWENMWELTNSLLLTLAHFLSPCSDKSWNVASLSSSAAASFFPACLRLAAACGSFPGLAGRSGNVCCFRGAKSRLRPLSHAQTSTQTTTDGWPTTTSTHSKKPLSHHAEPLTCPKDLSQLTFF